MSVKGCTKAMKWVLIAFNALVLCAGAIAIGLGAWGLASEYGAEKMKEITGSELYRGAAIAIIVGGCVMVVIAFLGFVGAFFDNRVLLAIYFVIMLLLLILFVVSTAVAFAYRDTLQEDITSRMTNSLLYQYGVNLNSSGNRDATDVWDGLQRNLQCCGVSGRSPSSQNSWFLWQKSGWFLAQASAPKKYVPESCCNTNYPNLSMCTSLNSNLKKPVQENVTSVTTESEYLYHKGCFDELKSKIREHILAIGGIAVAIVIVMFLCILFSICVCANIRSNKMVI